MATTPDQLFGLIKLLTDFQKIERVINVPGLTRKENDTEHSYNLAMAAWMLITYDKLPLDIDKVLKYALVHDLVELHAGDSNALAADQMATKAEREAAALQQLESDELLQDLLPYIHGYESRTDEEAKFVYSLDKIMPGLAIILDKQSTWIDHHLTQPEWEKIFVEKASLSPYTRSYLEALTSAQKTHPELFGDRQP